MYPGRRQQTAAGMETSVFVDGGWYAETVEPAATADVSAQVAVWAGSLLYSLQG